MNRRLIPLLFALLGRNRSPGSWIMIATCVVIYLLVQPILSKSLGIPLPGLFGGDGAPAVASTDGDDRSPEPIGDLVLKPKPKSKARTPTKGESQSDRPHATEVASTETVRQESSAQASSNDRAAQPPLGKLTEIGPKLFETTAGLRYGPGSVDGHRLLHVMQHAKDAPDKPVHGVFEGNEYEIRAMIDEAFLIADLRGPPQAKKEVDGNRTVWKVDMKRRVGHLGGEVGARKSHPPLTGIQLVLEGSNVITAYPIDPNR